jgi:hypothetical protein
MEPAKPPILPDNNPIQKHDIKPKKSPKLKNERLLILDNPISPMISAENKSVKDKIIKEIDNLSHDTNAENLQIITDQLEKEILDLQDLQLIEFEGNLTLTAINALAKTKEINDYVVSSTYLLPSTTALSTYQDITAALSVASTTLTTLMDLAQLIEKNKFLGLQKEILEDLKKERPQDLKKIQIINESIQNLESEISEMGKEICLNVVLASPGVTENIYTVVKAVAEKTEIIGSTAGIAIAASITSILASGYQLYQANKQSTEHATFTEDLHPVQLPDKILSPEDPITQPVINNKIYALLESRHKKLEAKIKTQEPMFSKWLNQLLNENVDDFNKFKAGLEKKGIFLDKKITNLDDFKIEIKNNPDFKKDLQFKHCEYLDTLTSTAKTLLKTRLLEQEKVNSRFFSFKLTKSKVMFGVTVVTAIGSIALYAALLAGAVFPPILLSIPPVMAVVATVGFIGLGIYHLYHNKPNLAKTIFQFVKLNILLNKIPLLFSSWRLEKAKTEEAKLQGKIDVVLKNALTSGSEIEINKYLDQREEVEQKIRFCEERFSKYVQKIESLENEITQARIDDFKLNTGFNSFEKKGDVVYMIEEEGSVITPKAFESTENLKDEFSIIAEALIEGQFWRDPEAAAFLKKYSDISLDKDIQLDSSNLTQDVSFLSKKLRDVVLRNSSEILEWLKAQEQKEIIS